MTHHQDTPAPPTQALKQRSCLSRFLGNHKQALADAAMAASQAPADAEAHACLGWAHYKLKAWISARESFAVAAKLAPDNTGEHFVLSRSLGLASLGAMP